MRQRFTKQIVLIVTLAVTALAMIPFAAFANTTYPIPQRFTVYLPLVATSAAPTLVHVIWVLPSGSTLTAPQRAAATEEIALGLAFWNAHDPNLQLQVADTEERQIADPYRSWEWLQGLADPTRLTIAVVVNQQSHRYVDLGGGVQAPAYNWSDHRTCYASLWAGAEYGHASLGAQIAHELGHALYQLPDGGPGIMGSPGRAFTTWRFAGGAPPL